MSVGAILLCAGKGKRLGGKSEKPLISLAGRPLFTWSLETLERVPSVEGIVVVGPVRRLQDALATSGVHAAKIVGWCEGGRERRDSVARGLQSLPEQFDWVLVHDCARPLLTPEAAGRIVAEALECGAAIAAVPLNDTLKRATLRAVDATVPRSGLWRAQTPQVFRRDWLESAHQVAAGNATDDAALVEALGRSVRIVEGDSINFKVTTAMDLRLAEAWLVSSSARA